MLVDREKLPITRVQKRLKIQFVTKAVTVFRKSIKKALKVYSLYL